MPTTTIQQYNPKLISRAFKILRALTNPKVIQCLDIIIQYPKINRTDIAIKMREPDPNRVGKFTEALSNAGMITKNTLKGTNFVQHIAKGERIIKLNKSIECIL